MLNIDETEPKVHIGRMAQILQFLPPRVSELQEENQRLREEIAVLDQALRTIAANSHRQQFVWETAYTALIKTAMPGSSTDSAPSD